MTVPPEPRLTQHTNLGVSVWANALVQVFAFFRPQAALVRDWTAVGLRVPVSTLSEGLRRLQPLFDGLLAEWDAWQARDRAASGRNQLAGAAAGARRRSAAALAVGVGDAEGRAFPGAGDAQRGVRAGAAGAAARDGPRRILVCDRWSAYKALAKECAGLLRLAFCWAHQRRDFRRVGTGLASLQEWAESWLDAIGELFWLAAERREAWDPQRALERQRAQFEKLQDATERVTHGLFDRARRELLTLAQQQDGARGHAWAELEAQCKALRSLLTHEDGLRVCVQHPEVPPDNNAAERAIRGPVISRYTSFGSGSASGALLAEQMYSIYATLHECGLNPYHWTQDYLATCARNGGQAPADLEPWLPWRMDDARRTELSRPPPRPGAAGAALGEPPEAPLARAA